MKFTMTQSTSASPLVVLLILIILFVGIITVLGSARFYSLEITETQLLIKGLVYKTVLNLDEIDLNNVKYINMNTEQLGMDYRSNGIGLPGLYVGWFKKQGQKYKLYVTDKEKVLYIPTTKNYTILFSTKMGDEIIKQLNQWFTN